MLLGILPEPGFVEQRATIAPGDVLLAYTDGVTEARRGRDLFGRDRLQTALRELVDRPAQVMAEEIYRRVCQFRDDSPADDITLLVAKFREPGGS